MAAGPRQAGLLSWHWSTWCRLVGTNMVAGCPLLPIAGYKAACRSSVMTFDAKEVVIDGRGHLLGRLASIVAKVS